MGLAVFSHFLLDLVMHPPDMALWPGSTVHLGIGLWRASLGGHPKPATTRSESRR